METALEEFDSPEDWDVDLVRQDLLMHYMVNVPELDDPDRAQSRRFQLLYGFGVRLAQPRRVFIWAWRVGLYAWATPWDHLRAGLDINGFPSFNHG